VRHQDGRIEVLDGRSAEGRGGGRSDRPGIECVPIGFTLGDARVFA
jgi:hypothetical protein